MAWKDCRDTIIAAAGRHLTDDEVLDIAEAVQQRMASKQAKGVSARQAATETAAELRGEASLQATRARADAYRNVLIHADLRASTIAGEEFKSETAAIAGRTSGTGRGYADSVDANHHGLQKSLLGPMTAALDKAGVLKLLTGGVKNLWQRDKAFDADVARELYRRKDPTAGPATGNSRAVAAAKILGDTLDTMRAMQNNAGAWIGEVDNYMGRQYHDMWKIREAGYKGWRDFTAAHLDLDKMFGDMDEAAREKSLKGTYDALKSGVHDSVAAKDLSGFQGTTNLGKKLSEDRTIQFKSADDWLAYNDKFGKGGVMDAIVSGADGAARNTALMQKFGTNPEAMYKRWSKENMDAAYARGDDKMGDKLKGGENGNANKGLLDVVTGKAAIPESLNVAYVGATVRNAMQLLSLKNVLFSGISHVAIASSVLRHNGIPFWGAVAHQIRALVPQGAATQEVAHALGAGIDGMMGHIINRFRSEDGIQGAMAQSVNVFHKLNGFSYLLDAQRTGAGLALSHNLAFHADKEFGALNPMMQATLRRYGVEGGEWDTARASTQKAADGRNYMMPGEISDPKVSQKIGTMITDQIRESLNDHTPWARKAATMGTTAGTVPGEIVRSLTQFKGFALTMMQRQLGRELTQNGIDVPGFLLLAGGMTLMGYAGNTLRDLALNRSPQHPKDAGGWVQVMTDAFVRGGAFGLLADGLLQDNAHTGADVMRSFAGPLVSKGADIVAAINSLRDGSNSKSRGQIALREGQKIAGEWMPNLFYTSAAYNYLFPYLLQNMANPGALGRANKLMNDRGQHWVMPP